MTVIQTTASTLLVAIDISKHRHEVLIGIPGKKRRRRLTVINTLQDFQRLSGALARYDLPVRIGFEATGNYHRTLAHHLGQAGFDLKLVSSVGLARTREALHNSWDKNDPKDAQVILHMLEIGAVQFFHASLVVGTADIQELSKTHEIVSRSKTELWHRILTHYLPLYFPEAERFHRSSRTDWFLAFLERYPSPHMISAMRKGAQSGKHEFDKLCTELDIEHRLTPPRSPQTNGMVERFNGRIEDVLQCHHFRSGEELEATLYRYAWLYNQQLPQSALGSKTPLQAMKDWHKLKPELFNKQPYYRPGCDS